MAWFTSRELSEFVGISNPLLDKLLRDGAMVPQAPRNRWEKRYYTDTDAKALAILLTLRDAKISRPWDELVNWVETIDQGQDTPLVSYYFDSRTKEMVSDIGKNAQGGKRYSCTIVLPVGRIIRSVDKALTKHSETRNTTK